MNKPLLDIGGLDKESVDRGLIIRRRGDFLVLTVAQNDMMATIELTPLELKNLRDAMMGALPIEEQAEEAVDVIFDIVNKMGVGEKILLDALTKAMHRQHRTLIQQFWGVIAQVVTAYSTMQHDLRNEDSIKWAKEVAKIESSMRYI